MNWKDIGGIVGKTAPLIGGLLGGPAGASVGSIVSSALGVPATPQSVAKALETDPAAMVKVLDLQSNERVRLAELAASQVEAEATREVELTRLDVEDRSSARKREVDAQDTTTPRALAMIVVFGFFASVGSVLAGWVGLSGETGVLVGTVIGYTSAKADQVLSYYFGSTAGSAAKTRLLAKADAVKD